MDKDEKLFLEHIMDSIRAIESFTYGIKEDDFYQNREKFDAVVRNLEIIGEASRHIDEEFRSKYSIIPWREITGMRDNLIHEYFGVDKVEVWHTIKNDIPELKKNIKYLLTQ